MLNSETIHPDHHHAPRAEGDRPLGEVKKVTEESNGAIRLHYTQGTLDFALYGDDFIQVTLLGTGDSNAVAGTKEVELPAVLPAEYVIDGQKLTLQGNKQVVEIDLQSSWITFGTKDGAFARQSGLSWNAQWKASAYFAKTAASRFYGLGEKAGFLNKAGERYEMWNTDVYSPHVQDIDALYQSIPFVIHADKEGAYGIFLDNPGRTFVDMRSFADSFSFGCAAGALRYYVITGPDLKSVVSRYTQLTGRAPMPPKWSLGYHQSRYSYMDQEEVLTLARTFREKGIPCDAIYLDIHYMESYRVFTFDPIRFPDPKAMMAELKEMGIRIVPIVDPGVKKTASDAVYREGLANDYFCRFIEGELFSGKVWPGESVFPDFSDPAAAAWWGDLHAFYTEIGISGIWNDMNEPSVFDSESKTMDAEVMHNNDGQPRTHGELHNLYGLWMSKATYLGLERLLDGERPFVLTRAGYAGIQKYAAVWTGDNRSYWEHLAQSIPMIMNLGMSGVAFTGADVGGFASHSGGELLARWTQAGALLPYFRNHSELGSIRQEPWAFGAAVEQICREYILLRYRLLPTIYSLFKEANETGVPIVRPLVLEYPNDPFVTNMNDQYMLGTDILLAPVLKPGVACRSVYLPEGQWYDYWTGERLSGGRHVLANAPLETMPIYIRGGAIIVEQGENAQHTTDPAAAAIRHIELYASASSSAETNQKLHYEDDGLTDQYRNGQYMNRELILQETHHSVSFSTRVVHAGLGEQTQAVSLTIHGLRNQLNQVRAWSSDNREIERLESIAVESNAAGTRMTLEFEQWPARIEWT
ncbi:alpha-glucosidase [Paenibacillus sp. PR3]|uniref:Alpha-glucosidase n=1 Tax=Paenibacillus terricola TaxID=2763503 RepID=A0ABR8MNM8_9BACL|nr:TIM-barrel domain-containing protein [Paenibacillus terricola]MBD3917553.1 alpha-glucosidase [Paenibacillus terricola]